MYTLENLPANGTLYVYVTGERYTPESLAHGDAEESGWIDWSWSATTLHVLRTYVRPLIAVDVADIDRGEILDAIRAVIGHADSSERGTIYATDATIPDYSLPDTFTYAVHVFVKRNTAKGYEESPVHIPLDEINGDHPSDCLYCAAGEASIHNYEPA